MLNKLNFLQRTPEEQNVKCTSAMSSVSIHLNTHIADHYHYITLHSLDPRLVRMTVGCGISHTNTKAHIQYNSIHVLYVMYHKL
jgi:hypothetical protein